MNKSKAKRLRKELEHETRLIDRGYAVQSRLLREHQRRQALDLVAADMLPRLKPLGDVQKAVHFEEAAAFIDAQPVPTDGRQLAP